MDCALIKVVNPSLAKKLADLGFQYIKDGNIYAFIKSDELMSILRKTYSDGIYICENKLRF